MTAPDIATPAMRAAFLRVVAAHAPGQTLDADSIRDDAKAGAQIPGAAMGGLLRGACYLFPVGYTTSRAESRRGGVIRRYERTRKTVDVVDAQRDSWDNRGVSNETAPAGNRGLTTTTVQES